MKTLVIGAGMMGKALAYDLAHSEEVESVLLADKDFKRAGSVAAFAGKNVTPVRLDAASYTDVVQLMGKTDVAVGATSYNHNLLLTHAAIEAGVHFCDLGGNMDVVYAQIGCNEAARSRGISVIPNCGLAPGLACIAASGGALHFDQLEEIHLRVGGLPLHPKPPLNYQLVFSAEGLINEYLEPSEVIRGGEIMRAESMTDIEEIEFPPPFGKMEAFHTSGGISTLPRLFKGKVKNLDYKTIRYKGHCEKFKTLLDLGFASSEPVTIGNTVRTAREIFEELLRRKLVAYSPDVILMRVTIKGRSAGSTKTLAYEMIDYYDDTSGISAMMRTTSFPASIIAQMAADGTITTKGVMPPEQCVPLDPLIEGLKKRNIVIQKNIS